MAEGAISEPLVGGWVSVDKQNPFPLDHVQDTFRGVGSHPIEKRIPVLCRTPGREERVRRSPVPSREPKWNQLGCTSVRLCDGGPDAAGSAARGLERTGEGAFGLVSGATRAKTVMALCPWSLQ